MNKAMGVALACLCLTSPAWAAPAPFTGADLSGSYACTGHDDHDGDYKATLALHLNRAKSVGSYGSYALTLDVVGEPGHYNGSMVVEGDRLAMMFASSDPTSRDMGTGLGRLSQDAQGHTTFSKFYFEPDYKGGDFGTETCTRMK